MESIFISNDKKWNHSNCEIKWMSNFKESNSYDSKEENETMDY